MNRDNVEQSQDAGDNHVVSVCVVLYLEVDTDQRTSFRARGSKFPKVSLSVPKWVVDSLRPYPWARDFPAARVDNILPWFSRLLNSLSPNTYSTGSISIV